MKRAVTTNGSRSLGRGSWPWLSVPAWPARQRAEGQKINKPLAFGVWLFFALSPQLSALSLAKTSTSPHFIIQTASPADEHRLPEVFKVLEQAYRDLLQKGYKPPDKVTVVVHANLESFRRTTKLPWFVLAVANRDQNRIDTQRLRIVAEKGLEATLRHELFHLAQPANWPRWKAEAMALRFAGQRPSARPIEGLKDADLDKLLANPPNPEMLSRAMATAYLRTVGTP